MIMEHWHRVTSILLHWQKGGVTSVLSRARFYLLAFTLLATVLYRSIMTLWLDRANTGTLHKLLYVFLDAATIPYVRSLVTSIRSDVPVASYRLGPDGRLPIYFATIKTVFCITYFIKDQKTMAEIAVLALELIAGLLAIVQLRNPAKDLNEDQVFSIVALGALFGYLGVFAKDSWTSFVFSLCCFPVIMCGIATVTGCQVQVQHLKLKEQDQHLLPV